MAPPPTPAGVKSLGVWTKGDNLFWEPYCRIESDALTAWDRQEPFRLEIRERLCVTPPSPNFKIVCDAPEIFLFPVGWSTTVWFRIIGPMILRDLPKLLWTLGDQPSIRLKPDGKRAVTLDDAMKTISNRVASKLYSPISQPRPKRILRQRIVSVIERRRSNFKRPYQSEDLPVVYGSLEPSASDQGPLWAMQASSLLVGQFNGHVVARFGRGIFVDLPRDKPRRIRCFARNLRNMVLMGAVLQSTVKFGARELPTEAASSSGLQPKRLRLRNLHRLVLNGQKILREVPHVYNPKVCRIYWGKHWEIQQALIEPLPPSG
jgi:hypothetical protein